MCICLFVKSRLASTTETVHLLANVSDYAFSLTWEFGNGDGMADASEAINYTWTTAGYYNITLTGTHFMGNKSVTVNCDFFKHVKCIVCCVGIQFSALYTTIATLSFSAKFSTL